MMSVYLMLKHLHVTCVAVSLTGFVVRGGLMLLDSPLLKARWMRIWPPVVDTLLLLSAIALAYQLRQAPLVHHWLTAKVAALLVYIPLGVVALRTGRSKAVRVAALIASMTVAAYIVSVALARDPRGFLVWMMP